MIVAQAGGEEEAVEKGLLILGIEADHVIREARQGVGAEGLVLKICAEDERVAS